MPEPKVRVMQPGDADGMVALFEEMQAHYRVPCPPAETVRRDLAALPPGTTILVAAAPVLVGFASLCAMYPGPGLRAGLFLKELYVSGAARSAGVGSALMRAAAQYAIESGFTRIDWTADRDDPKLLSFYTAVGASPQPRKLFFRIAGDALDALARAANVPSDSGIAGGKP